MSYGIEKFLEYLRRGRAKEAFAAFQALEFRQGGSELEGSSGRKVPENHRITYAKTKWWGLHGGQSLGWFTTAKNDSENHCLTVTNFGESRFEAVHGPADKQ